MKQWRLSINSISLIISYNPCIGEKKKTNENKYLLLITKNKYLFRRYLKYLVKKSDQSGSWHGVRVIRIKNLAIQHPGKEHLPMCSKPQQFSLLPLPQTPKSVYSSVHTAAFPPSVSFSLLLLRLFFLRPSQPNGQNRCIKITRK